MKYQIQLINIELILILLQLAKMFNYKQVLTKLFPLPLFVFSLPIFESNKQNHPQ